MEKDSESVKKIKLILKSMIKKWGDIEKIRDIAREIKDLEIIESWIEWCLQNSKDRRANQLLQDLVNVIGERLEFLVKFGKPKKDYDGVWQKGDVKMIVEVKSSSQWIKIDTVANYIKKFNGNCGLIVSSGFDKDHINSIKGSNSNIRLITFKDLISLAKMQELQGFGVEQILSILVPQENIELGNIIKLIQTFTEIKGEDKLIPKKTPKKDSMDIDAVDERIRDLGEVAKTMYLVLKENTTTWFKPDVLAKEIEVNFRKTFEDRKNPISLGFPWAGDSLEKRGLIYIKRTKPEPKKYPKWIVRLYKFKK